ncbi:MAG: hypothetical protein QXJ38_00630 [Thermofilaceae archaeon]
MYNEGIVYARQQGSTVAKPYLVRVKSVEDLVNIAVAAQLFIVHRVNVDARSVLYVPFPAYDAVSIYYCETEGVIAGKYLLFNRFTGEVQVSESYVNDSKYIVIPIVEVLEQEILPKELLEKSRQKKGKKKLKEKQTAIVH